MTRRIGPIGTVCRIVVGLGLLALAWYEGRSGLLSWVLVLGAVVFPLAMVAVVLIARRFVEGPIRFMDSRGLMVNCGVLVVLFLIPYTRGAAALFYGVSLLIAAWLALPGCEATSSRTCCFAVTIRSAVRSSPRSMPPKEASPSQASSGPLLARHPRS